MGGRESRFGSRDMRDQEMFNEQLQAQAREIDHLQADLREAQWQLEQRMSST